MNRWRARQKLSKKALSAYLIWCYVCLHVLVCKNHAWKLLRNHMHHSEKKHQTFFSHSFISPQSQQSASLLQMSLWEHCQKLQGLSMDLPICGDTISKLLIWGKHFYGAHSLGNQSLGIACKLIHGCIIERTWDSLLRPDLPQEPDSLILFIFFPLLTDYHAVQFAITLETRTRKSFRRVSRMLLVLIIAAVAVCLIDNNRQLANKLAIWRKQMRKIRRTTSAVGKDFKRSNRIWHQNCEISPNRHKYRLTGTLAVRMKACVRICMDGWRFGLLEIFTHGIRWDTQSKSSGVQMRISIATQMFCEFCSG